MTGRLADYIAGPGARIIALVGAGGKTSLAYALARELIKDGEFVAFTKTTNVTANTFRRDAHLIVEPEAARMRRELNRVRQTQKRLVGLATGYIRADLLQGLSPSEVTDLVSSGAVDRVIVEADGARRRRIKAPSEQEPNLPAATDALVAVVSADAIGLPLSEETAHRPELVSGTAGLELGAAIGPTHVARLLTSRGRGTQMPASRRSVRLRDDLGEGRQSAGCPRGDAIGPGDRGRGRRPVACPRPGRIPVHRRGLGRGRGLGPGRSQAGVASRYRYALSLSPY